MRVTTIIVELEAESIGFVQTGIYQCMHSVFQTKDVESQCQGTIYPAAVAVAVLWN
jgi:hypothetical protein